MIVNIRCADGCGEKLGTVDLPPGKLYKGDARYGMLCDDCAKERRVAEEKRLEAERKKL